MRHSRRPARPARLFRLPRIRLTCTNFAFLLSMLVLPTIYFYSRLTSIQDTRECAWVRNPPLVCAHGGDSSRALSNTLKAYELALMLQVDCIEIDASRTSDGVLVALHDRDLQNMSGVKNQRVGDLTSQQILEISANWAQFSDQRIPTLERALQFVHRSVKLVIIDVKVGPPLFRQNLAADVLAAVKKVGCDNCLVWCKLDTVVVDYLTLSAGMMSGYIVMNDTASGKLLRLAEPDVIGVFHGLVNENLVATAHRAQKKVYVWTVDDRGTMQHILEQGVDCIVTGQPRSLQQVMQQYRRRCRNQGYSF